MNPIIFQKWCCRREQVRGDNYRTPNMGLTTLVGLLLTALTALGAERSEWKNVQPLDIATPGLVKFSLPVETLDAARPGLEDLRIYDGEGREVAYLIERPISPPPVMQAAKDFRFRLQPPNTILEITTGVAQPIDALTLESTAPAFVKAVSVEGSVDRQHWQSISSGQPIFRQWYGVTQLRLELPARIWPFLRVTVDDRRTDAIPFTGARLHVLAGEPAPVEDLPVRLVDRVDERQTRLTLDLGGEHLTLVGLRLETEDPLFMRAVNLAIRQVSENAIAEQIVARDAICRVAVPGLNPAERIELPLNLTVPGRELLVLIDNEDNPPLRITAVRATRRPVYVVFLAHQPGRYQVLTGNPGCPAPRYDVAVLGAQLKSVPVRPLNLSPLADNPTYRRPEAVPELLPEIEDLGTPLDTTHWQHRKLVQVTRDGVQQLDLDLNVLAQADDSFRDLRLVRDSKQHPYILERTSLSRKLIPEMSVTAPEPSRPALSRWRIKLPAANLPVTRLTCTSTSALFQRQLVLYELITNERGEKFNRNLGQAIWVRTPPATAQPLQVNVSLRPLTDTLILETDNGDNPPIELANAQLFYPVTRILFKAPTEPPTYLYYGNRVVGFPQYDLNLIAPRLLAATKSVAKLEASAPVGPTAPVAESGSVSGTKSIVFWVALSLVVVVLLIVIARLLPKTPPAAP